MSDHAPRLPHVKQTPKGYAATEALEHSRNVFCGLERSLLKIVWLRVSLLNGCEFSLGHHPAELGKAHEPESLIAPVADCRNSDAFTQRQRADLLWSHAITNIQQSHASNADYDVLGKYFAPREVVDLTKAISSINAWNCAAIAFRSLWDSPQRSAVVERIAGVKQAAAATVDDPEIPRLGTKEPS